MLEVVEIKQTDPGLKLTLKRNISIRKNRNRRYDAIISEQIVLSKFFYKQIMVDL